MREKEKAKARIARDHEELLANNLLTQIIEADETANITCSMRNVQGGKFWLSTRLEVLQDGVRSSIACHGLTPLHVMQNVKRRLEDVHARGYDLVLSVGAVRHTVHVYPMLVAARDCAA